MQTENTYCHIRELGLLSISGKDASKLLQGQLTCDVTKLTQGLGQLGAHCNPQGRVISLFILFIYHETYYLLMPLSLIDLALAALKKYAIFYKIELRNVSDEMKIMSLNSKMNNAQENIMTVSFLSQTFLIGAHAALEQLQHQTQAKPIDEALWKYQLLMSGIPLIYPETSGLFLPHELNLPELGAVSFDKGCYTGQEIIARMHYRGKLKTHLYLTHLDASQITPPGTTIFVKEDDQLKEGGTIVDMAATVYNKPIALIITEDKYAKDHLLSLADGNSFFSFFNAISEK